MVVKSGCYNKTPGWAVYLSVGYPGPWWTGPLMEQLAFTRAILSDVRVIMAIMCVLLGSCYV
jgi:hypothetical protein